MGALEWEIGWAEEGAVPVCEGLNDWCLLGFYSVATAATAGPEATDREQEQELGRVQFHWVWGAFLA